MSNKIYNKANSILELRGLSKQRKHILDVLKMQKNSTLIKKDDISQQALKDLFSNETNKSNSRENFHLRDHVVEELSKLEKSNYCVYR